MMADDTLIRPELRVTRVRHPLKIRSAQVARIAKMTPHTVRVTLSGEDLRDFDSASFDDHMKVFFPIEGADKPLLPVLGPDGPVMTPGAARPIGRDYTPRRFNRDTGELDIDFVLHDAGPATQWAAQARPGQTLGIGGPRGSTIIPKEYDWHLLVGDDTALPAIARRLEELPKGSRAIVLVEVQDSADRIDLLSPADTHVTWIDRAGSAESTLVAALRDLPELPAGEGYAWVAAETSVVREARLHLINDRKIDKKRIRAAAYWKRGVQAVHEVIED